MNPTVAAVGLLIGAEATGVTNFSGRGGQSDVPQLPEMPQVPGGGGTPNMSVEMPSTPSAGGMSPETLTAILSARQPVQMPDITLPKIEMPDYPGKQNKDRNDDRSSGGGGGGGSGKTEREKEIGGSGRKSGREDVVSNLTNPDKGAQAGDAVATAVDVGRGADEAAKGAGKAVNDTVDTLTKTGATLSETAKAATGKKYSTGGTFAEGKYGKSDRQLYQGSLVSGAGDTVAGVADDLAGSTDEAVGRATEAAKKGDVKGVVSNLSGGLF